MTIAYYRVRSHIDRVWLSAQLSAELRIWEARLTAFNERSPQLNSSSGQRATDLLISVALS